ncbi:hypothetical protein FACS1894168_3830 [Deltaproteobacteria bacterium]|nr:hypothetical protein FACS1894168_3830 [Deltaproteobacteria bacterium]
MLPDAFSPFYWRVLFEDKASVYELALNMLGQPRGPEKVHTAMPPAAAASFARQSVVCREFFDFALLPALLPLPDADLPANKEENDSANHKLVYDLRFGTGHDFVRRIMQLQPNGDRPFQLLLEYVPDPDMPWDNGPSALSKNVKISRERLRFSGGGNKDSGWRMPVAPSQPDMVHWLMGLR